LLGLKAGSGVATLQHANEATAARYPYHHHHHHHHHHHPSPPPPPLLITTTTTTTTTTTATTPYHHHHHHHSPTSYLSHQQSQSLNARRRGCATQAPFQGVVVPGSAPATHTPAHASYGWKIYQYDRTGAEHLQQESYLSKRGTALRQGAIAVRNGTTATTP
jgi:hypothetical protein